MTDYLKNPGDIHDLSVARALDQTSRWSMAFGQGLLDRLDLRPNTKGLDIGCGTGFPLLELASLHDDSCHFTGIDVWNTGLARAREKLVVYGLANVDLVELEGDRFPLEDDQFDLITANLVLNNLDQPDITLGECARVAKPGARIAITTNLNGHMREFYTVFSDLLREMDQTQALNRLRASAERRGTATSHVHMLERHGFQVHRQFEETLTLRYLNGSAFLRSWFIRIAFLEGWQTLIDEESRQSVFSTLEQRLNQVSEHDKELRLTVPMLYLECHRA